MPDPVQLDEIRTLFVELTAVHEDTAGIAACGQRAANLDDARKGHACLAGLCVQVAELMDRLEAQLR